MSSDTSTPDAATAPDADAEEEAPRDEQREAILARLVEALGDGVVAHHIRPGDDLWVRVTREAWAEAGRVARDRLGCRTLGFISAIDWLPSPYGRYLDSEVDNLLAAAAAGDAAEAEAGAAGDAVADEPGADEPGADEPGADEPGADEAGSETVTTLETGYAGGDTRFQVFARVLNIKEHWGFTLKVDVPDDDLRVDTWVANYAGANWHERECWEMFGIVFEGHPFLRKLYLPGEFEGYPLRKDFPLLARMVKAWPGIVDVEDMPPLPEEDDDKDGDTPADGGGEAS